MPNSKSLSMKTETQNDSGKILIVDDTLDNLRLLTQLLKDHGYHVRASKTGREALASAKASLPELVLLDVNLPDMNGYEVCEQLKASDATKAVPVIFLSVLDATGDKLKGFKVGGVDFITKPFHPLEVLSRIDTHIKISRMQAQLRALNSEKDKFFSIIAHDLRSPISAFMGLTEILDEGLFDMPKERLQKIAHSMRTSATNLYRLLDNLLQWSQMKQGAIEFNPVIIRLHPVIQENVALLIEAAEAKQIEITQDVPLDTEVIADAHMLHSIIRNLASNAVKFTPKGGKVSISAKTEKTGLIEILFQDTGIGMSREIMDNLFRLEVNTGRKGTEGEPSSGLGLLLCKEFIEKNGGDLQVKSEEGKGSFFYFTLKK
jgi:two-component system sensor histidine kinase/response regulator